MLGLLHDCDGERIPNFIATTTSSFSLAASDRRFSPVLECHYGRALFLSDSEGNDTQELLLWEPITGAQQRVPVPVAYDSIYADEMMYQSAVVFCAADGCDHRDCLGGLFMCLLSSPSTKKTATTTTTMMMPCGCVYTRRRLTPGVSWPCCTTGPGTLFTFLSGVLIGRSLLYFMSGDAFIL